MRWIENGNKRKIGMWIFIISLLVATCILLWGCVPLPAYRVKAGEKKVNVYEGYDHLEIIQNRHLKSKAEFAKDVEEQAK